MHMTPYAGIKYSLPNPTCCMTDDLPEGPNPSELTPRQSHPEPLRLPDIFGIRALFHKALIKEKQHSFDFLDVDVWQIV